MASSRVAFLAALLLAAGQAVAAPTLYSANGASVQVVFLGDSLTWGTGSLTPYPNAFASLTACTYYNAGISGQTSAQIQSRFQTDVVDRNPRYVILMAGTNDGLEAAATYVARIQGMVDSANAAGIVPVVLTIPPRTNANTALSQTYDAKNAGLATLTGRHLLITNRATLGQTRAGGDAGNVWDLKPSYDADGVHCNTAGYAALAQRVSDVLLASEWVDGQTRHLTIGGSHSVSLGGPHTLTLP